MEEIFLTESEQVVMKCIWDSPVELTLSDVTKSVNADYGKDWKPQTVSTFLCRLVRKGFLSSYRKGRYFFYQTLVKERDYKKRVMKRYIKFWEKGDGVGFVMSLCEDKVITDDEISNLKEKLK